MSTDSQLFDRYFMWTASLWPGVLAIFHFIADLLICDDQEDHHLVTTPLNDDRGQPVNRLLQLRSSVQQDCQTVAQWLRMWQTGSVHVRDLQETFLNRARGSIRPSVVVRRPFELTRVNLKYELAC